MLSLSPNFSKVYHSKIYIRENQGPQQKLESDSKTKVNNKLNERRRKGRMNERVENKIEKNQ